MVHAPGLKSLTWGLQVGEIIKGIGATKMVVAVQILKLDLNGKEVDTLKFFKEHK